MSNQPIIRQPEFTVVFKISKDSEDLLDQLEEQDYLDANLITQFAKSHGEHVYTRLDTKAAIIETVGKDQYQICLWGDPKDLRPQNMMAISSKIIQSTETIETKTLFGKKSETAQVITTVPQSVICGPEFQGLLLYKMSCCEGISAMAAFDLLGDTHSFNRDPVSGILNGQDKVFENIVRRADAGDLKSMYHMALHALGREHKCHDHAPMVK